MTNINTKRGSFALTIIYVAIIWLSLAACSVGGEGDGDGSTKTTAVKPAASPAAGTYTTAQTVYLLTATEGASIYYTTDNSNPTKNSTLFTSPITISTTTTLKAITVKEGMTDSDILTAVYTIGSGIKKIWTEANKHDYGNIFVNIMSIVYGDGKFVAINAVDAYSSNYVAYSSDGINWTRVGSIESDIESRDSTVVTYGAGRFVTGGRKGNIATSTDGIEWKKTYDHPDIGEIKTITYGGPAGDKKFIIVGWNGMAYSNNGLTWTKFAPTLFNKITVDNIEWCNDKFFAAYRSYSYDSGSLITMYSLAYSTDGINWSDTVVTDNTYTGLPGNYGKALFRSFTYGNGMYVAGAVCGSGIIYSSDGITWTPLADSLFKYPYIYGDAYYSFTLEILTTHLSIAYGNGKFVAVNYSGKTAVSTDGKTWSLVCDDDPSAFMETMIYGNGKFVGGYSKFLYWDGN